MTFACRATLAINMLALSCSFQYAQETAQQPVARIGGTILTLGELQTKESGKLLQPRFQFYLSERKVLEEAIDERLLENEAARKQMSVDKLLDTEVYKGITDPTEDQLKVYYEGLETQESYESVRTEVLQHIRDLRRTKARAAYLADLRKSAEINILLMPPAANVDTSAAFAQGTSNAPVTLVEFADYQCPYCQNVNPQIQRLKKDYGDSLRIVYKDFPLPMHASSEKAAEAARCAGEQGKFWEYHDVLFYSKMLGPDDLREHARVLRLDTDRFDKCLDSGTEADAVKKDLQEAKDLGLTGTPSFFINGHFYSGVIDYAALKDIINQQLNAVAATKQMLSQK